MVILVLWKTVKSTLCQQHTLSNGPKFGSVKQAQKAKKCFGFSWFLALVCCCAFASLLIQRQMMDEQQEMKCFNQQQRIFQCKQLAKWLSTAAAPSQRWFLFVPDFRGHAAWWKQQEQHQLTLWGTKVQQCDLFTPEKANAFNRSVGLPLEQWELGKCMHTCALASFAGWNHPLGVRDIDRLMNAMQRNWKHLRWWSCGVKEVKLKQCFELCGSPSRISGRSWGKQKHEGFSATT